MMRVPIVGDGFGMGSERRLCEAVHLHLAYRWFRRPGPDGDIPDHSTCSKNRHGRFRESDLLRWRDVGRAEDDLAGRSGGPLHRFGQPHRSEACGNHGRRGDDGHS
jgi:Transposase domain (DUF772)